MKDTLQRGKMDYLLGLDIGTGGVKALLIDSSGKTIASKTSEIGMDVPRPLWAEQNPEDWWNATVKSIRDVLSTSGISADAIKGIGLSGQMHSLVLLDKSMKVMRPSILWCDNRTTSQRRWIEEKVGLERLKELVANPPLEGFTLPKVIWVREEEPDIYRNIYKICLPKDYIRFLLTGELTMEVSDAAGTIMFDVRNRRWSEEVLSMVNVSPDFLPPVTESIDVSGHITQAIADETGLKAGTPVVGGGADNPCGAVGNGIVREGRISASLGTSGVIFAHTDSVKIDPAMRVHTFCHTVPHRWYLMGVVLSAGGAFRWFRDVLGLNETGEAEKTGMDPYEVLTRKAAEAPQGSEGLFFLPYLSGERTPHQDGRARGAWIGMTLGHQRRHMIRAVLEGITFAMRDSIEIMRELGISVKQVRATGGGGKSPFWRQMMADIFNTEVVTVNSGEGPAFGAAVLAGVGARIFESVEEASDSLVKPVDSTEPQRNNADRYEEYYRLFRTLYPALKETYQNIAGTNFE